MPYPIPFGADTKIQKLKTFVTFALTVKFLKHVFRYIFSRASSFYSSVHFIPKSSSTSVPLDMRDNFYKVNCFLFC